MIYFDCGATSLQKPPEVLKAVADGITSLGNYGRSFHTPSVLAGRAIFSARREVAKLLHLEDAQKIAFTSNATESLNLVIQNFISENDHVITSELEHNSVLRPLYKTGCELSFLKIEDSGTVDISKLSTLVKINTKAVVLTHGSNLLGSIIDISKVYDFCKAQNILLIADVSQTFGAVEVSADMADIICFTGHKSLLGPQGTGGIVIKNEMELPLAKTGGTGGDSFEKHQKLVMPDAFEAGTANTAGLAGLCEGVKFINNLGIEQISKHEKFLRDTFVNEVLKIPKITLYGEGNCEKLAVIALNIADFQSEDVALMLWEDYEIATRSGVHCAPLVHRHFGTENRGMVRFSFGIFNTLEEIEIAIKALKDISSKG